MPSLTDTLNLLSEHAAQITESSAFNTSPAGPYTTAYLSSLPSSSTAGLPLHPSKRRRGSTTNLGVLSLIRDAHDSEARLFKFIGESEHPGIGRVKKVEKREGHGIDVRSVGASIGKASKGEDEGEGREKDEVEIMLKTALKLIDDYRPMPRARATIVSLLENHHDQLEKIAELELKIEEASNTTVVTSLNAAAGENTSKATLSDAKTTKGKLSFEEIVKLEERSLKQLESKLAPLRNQQQTPLSEISNGIDNNQPAAIPISSSLTSSPPISSKALSSSTNQRTPAKTPNHPRITNSLVNGTTPRRARAEGPLLEGFNTGFDRFSPLKFLGTPRASARGSTRSTLREVMGSPAATTKEKERVEMVGAGIFERRITSGGAPPSTVDLGGGSADVFEKETHYVPDEAEQEPEEGEDEGQREEGDEDQTVKYGSGAEGDAEESRAEEEIGDETMKMEKKDDRLWMVHDVDTEVPSVEQGIARLRQAFPELLQIDNESLSVEDALNNLFRISQSDPAPPPSPSSNSSSTLTSHTSIPPKAALTPQLILTAHLILILFRNATRENNDPHESMNELKDQLTSISRARGWEKKEGEGGGGGGMATTCIYALVGKRIAKIDRKSPNGGKLHFAL